MEGNNIQNTRNIIINTTFFLMTFIVILDFYALYNTISHLKKYVESDKFDHIYFDECIKYQCIAEITFGIFGSLAGVSACIAGFSFIVNFEYFSEKCFKTFFHINYLVFGPYLFGCTFLGLHNFNRISYFCLEKDNLKNKSLNLLIVFCIFLSLSVSSFIISLFYPMNIISFFNDSIRFNDGGSYILGNIFWKYVFERNGNIILNYQNDNINNNRNEGNFLDEFDHSIQLYAQN